MIRNYDSWKTRSPDDEADAQSDQPVADCDCCGKRRPVFKTWYLGLETWACEECTIVSKDRTS